MKKYYLQLFIALFFCSQSFAQAYIAQVDKGKAPQAASAIRLPYNSDQVEDALKSYMSGKGIKGSSSRGFIVYRGVPLSEGDQEGADLYFVTSTPDRKQKDMTVLSLVPARKNQDISGATFVDSSKLDAARGFLDNITPFINTFVVGVQIKTQQDGLQKAQKKLDNLRNDSSDTEKKLRDLRSDLAQTQADQVKAASDLKDNIGADNDTKTTYQKRVNKLLDKEASLEKKIRKEQSNLDDDKADIGKQLTLVSSQQQGLEATKSKQNP